MEFKYSKNLKFDHLVNGYKRFDPSRGLDYKLDLNFKDIKSSNYVQKRYSFCMLYSGYELNFFFSIDMYTCKNICLKKGL